MATGAAAVVKVIAEYPEVQWWGDVVAKASTVTATFVRKLLAAFACMGRDYRGGGGGGGGGGGCGGALGDRLRGGGSQERFVHGGDRVADRGAMSRCMDLLPRADILSARPRWYRWEQWEQWGWWEH